MVDNVIFSGPERQLNFKSGGLDGVTLSQFDPAVASLTGGGYVVTYASDSGGGSFDVYYQFLDANGVPAGNTLSHSFPGFQTNPSVAGRTDGGFIGVYDSLIANFGGLNASQILLDNFGPGGVPAPSVQIDGSSATAPANPPFRVFDPDVARLASGEFLIVYVSVEQATGTREIKFNTFNAATGVVGTAQFLTSTPASVETSPAVAANTAGNTALVVYMVNQDIHARLFDTTTATFGATLVVADSATSNFTPDVAVLTDGRYVIVWTEEGVLTNGRIFDPATNSFGTPFLVNGTAGDQGSPQVAALPGGGFVVTWEEGSAFDGDVETAAILARRFNAAGVPNGDVFLVNTSTSDEQLVPGVASHPDGRFEIVWRDFSRQNTTDLSAGIKGQGFSLPDTAGLLGETTDGTPGDDILSGYPLSETFNGVGGDDIVLAGGGNDTVNAGLGEDIVRGESGDDTVDGGANDDFLRGDSGGDTLRGGIGNDRLDGGTENDRLFGDAGDDLLLAGAGIDVLRGGIGNDRLDGGTQNDQLFGESGNDLMFGRDGIDILRGGSGIDRLDCGSGNDRAFGESGNDLMFGGDGNDILDGGLGNDRLEGGKGLDLLIGGRGADFLVGGAGRDTYDFNSILESLRGSGRDTVVFRRADGDKIDLRTIDADSDTAGNQAFVFIGGAAFSDTDRELRFAGGLLQGDVNGNGIADIEIRVSGALLRPDIFL